MASPQSSQASRRTPAVAVSEELFAPVGGGIELCYQTFGDPGGEPVLLVMGLGGQLTWWDPRLCTMLAERGCFVIRYDNRDAGRSSRVGGRVRKQTLVRAFAGLRVHPPYTMGALAEDGFSLLDHLGLESAHVVGVSMGGMIAQTMAIERPDRVRSLTSMMSTTGKRTVGWQHPALLPTFFGRRPGREAYIESSVRVWRTIGSESYPMTEDEIRAQAAESWDRGVSAQGTMRQMLAILTQRDRAPRLRGLRVPATVVHGMNDKMVHVSGGRATATAIPGAELLLIDGMGHDLPPALNETFADAILRTVARA